MFEELCARLEELKKVNKESKNAVKCENAEGNKSNVFSFFFIKKKIHWCLFKYIYQIIYLYSTANMLAKSVDNF